MRYIILHLFFFVLCVFLPVIRMLLFKMVIDVNVEIWIEKELPANKTRLKA